LYGARRRGDNIEQSTEPYGWKPTPSHSLLGQPPMNKICHDGITILADYVEVEDFPVA